MKLNNLTAYLSNALEISHNQHTSLSAMEGLRGVAVFLVFLVHYCSTMKPIVETDSITYGLLDIIHNVGNIGVDLFFVLSGFLIYGTLIKKKETKFLSYMKRRVVRIYPTFLVMLTIYLALSYIFPNESKIPAGYQEAALYILKNALLLPGLFDIKPIITVAWSLSYELFYYLLIPAVIGLLQLRRWNYQTRTVFFIGLSIIGFWIIGSVNGPIRLMMFLSGILLFEVYQNKAFSPIKNSGIYCFIGLIILYAVFGYFQFSSTIQVILLFVAFFYICLESFWFDDGSAKFFSIKWVRWLGNMSYSYYLMHALTLKALSLVFFRIFDSTIQLNYVFWLVLPLFFLITLITSFGLFIMVEKPISLTRK